MDTNTVLFVALLVVLFVGLSAVWVRGGSPGQLWLKLFGAEAKLEQGESKDISQNQVGGSENEQEADALSGIKIAQNQRNGTKNSQTVRVRNDK